MVDPLSTDASEPTSTPPSTAVNFMSLLSSANRLRLIQSSKRAVYPAGTIALRPGGPIVACVIEDGLARAFWSLPDGRQTTVAIVRPGELVGGSAIMGYRPAIFMQIVTESTLTLLAPETLTRLSATQLDVSVAMSRHLAMRVRDAYRLIAVRSLGNIRERMAYDLLDRAAQSQLVVGRLEVIATQGDLADSIGSSREVMSRALRDLRAEGIVETAPGVIRVLDPARLAAIVRAFVI